MVVLGYEEKDVLEGGSEYFLTEVVTGDRQKRTFHKYPSEDLPKSV